MLTNEQASKLGDILVGAIMQYAEVCEIEYVVLGRAAEEATREMHYQARDKQWEKAVVGFFLTGKNATQASAEASCGLIRARLLSLPQSLQERVERVLIKHTKHLGVVDCAAEIVALLENENE